MEKLKISKATVDDAMEIGELIVQLSKKFITHEFTPEAEQHFVSSNDGKAVEKFIQADYFYFVAQDSERIVGAIGVKKNAHLYHLFVDESYQGKGLARQLWGEAMKECMCQGNTGHFTVNSSKNAVAVYEKLGFVRNGPMLEKDGISYNPMEYHIDQTSG
jgi:ribosomal protein S18 acetylase RimI-like enzyme